MATVAFLGASLRAHVMGRETDWLLGVSIVSMGGACALLAAILACTGAVPSETIGLPESPLLLRALARLDAPPEDVMMLGDTVGTDGAGARRLGMQFMAVEPGRRFALHAL